MGIFILKDRRDTVYVQGYIGGGCIIRVVVIITKVASIGCSSNLMSASESLKMFSFYHSSSKKLFH